MEFVGQNNVRAVACTCISSVVTIEKILATGSTVVPPPKKTDIIFPFTPSTPYRPLPFIFFGQNFVRVQELFTYAEKSNGKSSFSAG
jgi:hypothetical protein